MICPTPEKRFYQTESAANDAAFGMWRIFGKPMYPYGCACGRFHLKSSRRVMRSKSTPTRLLSTARKRGKRQRYRNNVRARKIANMTPEQLEFILQKEREAMAYQIRAELVCCNAYDHADGDHPSCYWGEAAARIVEGRKDD